MRVRRPPPNDDRIEVQYSQQFALPAGDTRAGVTALRREVADGVVAPVVAQALLDQAAVLQHDHVAGQVGQAPFKFERIFQPAQVAAGVVHIGLLHLDIVQADAVDVEQIMRQIRARIREKRGADYTEQEIRELVAAHGAAVNIGRPVRQLIEDGELPRLRGCTVLEGKVSDSVFGDALKTRSGKSLRLMFRNNRISTHDVNRGAIPFKDQVLAFNHDRMLRLVQGRLSEPS